MDSLEFNPSFCYLFAVVIVLADQSTKLVIEQYFHRGEILPVIEWFNILNITFVTNTGAAWGILRGYNTFLVLVSLLVSCGCVWIIEKSHQPMVRFAAGCIFGGGIGNMLDRMFLSYGVVDFIDAGIYTLRWPTFNVADMMLSLGMIVFLTSLLRSEEFLFESKQSRESHPNG